MKRIFRFLATFLMTFGLLIALSHLIRLSQDCPIWLVALGAAAAVELIVWLYQYEAGAVSTRRARWIIGLRLAALAVLVWILIAPVWVRTVSRERQREVVVVMDDSGSMQLKDDGAKSTRIELGEQAISNAKLIEQLGEKLRVRVVKAARSVRGENEAVSQGWGDSTDLAAALNTVLEQVPPDELAGVVMVSDGRHNRPERVEDVARRFGILDAPVGIVAVGSAEPPKDAAILSVKAPEAIHLGDRMRVTAEVKFDGYKGQKANVQLRRGDQVLETREVAIPQDHHVEELRFAQVPDQGGVGGYRVEISSLDGERFSENNSWEFETSITDARTNVLLIEGYSRWEFRYLRNLFYGRDKSVHLQHVLLHPDQIAGQTETKIAASASRPFGESLATKLPESEAEWRKFDVIILGDLDPSAVDEATWSIISRCVNERAALLVMVSGPRFMPHAIASATGRALVPAEFQWGNQTYFNLKDEPFRFGLTGDGRRHPVTQQSDGQTANERLWAEFPSMTWRHPVTGLKEGAEVLLSALNDGKSEVIASNTGLESALDALAQRKARETTSALLVARQTGKGKVALLLTDRTWRLREGAGDLYHHRFWGNLVRWGAGPVMRAGGSRARLGTDQLTYTPDDPVKLTARLRDTSLKPVDDTSLRADVFRDGQKVSTVPMKAVAGSNGLYEAAVDRLADSGRYEVRMQGEKADTLVKEDGAAELKAGFRVVGSRGPVELSETTLNLPLLETVAELSGGKVVSTENAGLLAALFLSDKDKHEETREITLWDRPWVLALLALLLGGEWVIRRAGGLP